MKIHQAILPCAAFLMGGCHGIKHESSYPGGRFENNARASAVSTNEKSSYYQECLAKNEGIPRVEAMCQRNATVWQPGDTVCVAGYYGYTYCY